MKFQGGFDVFKESTRYMFEAPSLSDVLFVVLGIAFFVGFLIAIELNAYPIRAIGAVKNIRGGLDRICLGIRKLLRFYKMEEAKEGSFSS